jgi:hypothetical protein
MAAYLKVVAHTALAILLGAAAVNWFVDPFAIYGTPRIDGFNALKPGIFSRARLFKTVNVARGNWNALIIGTSRAEIGLDPGHSLFRGKRCFNAALAGQPYKEGLRLVEAALARGTLLQVVALVDFPVSNAHYSDPADFVDDNYRPWRPLELAFSAVTLLQSLSTPFRQDKDQLRDEWSLWNPDGSFELPTPKQGHHVMTLKSEWDYLHKNYFPPPRYSFELSAMGRDPMKDVRGLIALSGTHNIELILIIPPVHARQTETVFVAGLWLTWEQWKRRLVAINEDEARKGGWKPFPIWDFSDYNAMTTETFPSLAVAKTRMKWYWESSHFTKATGDLALDRIEGKQSSLLPTGFGVLLTSENLEAHLARIRAKRLAWLSQNRSDVMEVEFLGAEAEHFRRAARNAYPIPQ